MFSRRAFLAVLPAALVLASGCAQQESTGAGTAAATPTAPAASASAGAKTLKVGLITPGSIADKGWSELAYTTQQKVKTELGAETAPPVEKPALSDVASVLRAQSQAGCNLVFIHGQEFDPAAKSIAPSIPQTTLVVMNGKQLAPNLFPIQFASGQATYLAGMLAGGMTKTNKLGLVGGVKNPSIDQSFDAFIRGAKAVNPQVQVTKAYTGGEDIARARQQTQALLEAGVDVVMHNANAGGQGVAQAVTDKPGTYFIGANADQSDLATPQNLGSFILDVPSAMIGVARAVQSGETGGKPFLAGIKDKAVYFKYNPKFKGTIPADLKAKITAAETALAAGTLDPAK